MIASNDKSVFKGRPECRPDMFVTYTVYRSKGIVRVRTFGSDRNQLSERWIPIHLYEVLDAVYQWLVWAGSL